MDVKTDSDFDSAGDLRRKFSDVEQRLRVAELERVDLVQSVRLTLRSAAGLLRHRGFNNDLADELKRLETRLGAETDHLELLEEAAAAISKMSGKFEPMAEWHAEWPPQAERDESSLKEALAHLVDQLVLFRNRRYQRVGETIKSLSENGGSLEGLLPVVVDLCQRFIQDYGNELDRISHRLSGIIRILLFTEREYARFLDVSIEDLQGGTKQFNDNLAVEMGQIHDTVTEAMVAEDPESLLGLVVEKIDVLFQAVLRKSREDEDRLGAMRLEKTQLQNRLDTIRRDYDNFMRQSRTVLRELEVVKLISLRDQLTGVYNRRAFDEQTRLALENFEKGHLSAFSLIIFDIDMFREVNNNYGHLAGDRILANLARVVAEALRGDDFVFRYGGDEFIVVLPEAGLGDAAKVAEKLRRQIEVVDFKLSRQSEASIHVTISLGVAEAVYGDSASSLLARADAALYESKNSGRNRMTLAQPDEVPADLDKF
ncbi:MAG: GGDEF domain-containing protein [Deltaproteobacteria bacterium]|jgi:diguanylate cyclase|nr:GGDEF domain-containing protein [Deltaproteobacteria bacterium]